MELPLVLTGLKDSHNRGEVTMRLCFLPKDFIKLVAQMTQNCIFPNVDDPSYREEVIMLTRVTDSSTKGALNHCYTTALEKTLELKEFTGPLLNTPVSNKYGK
jgi:hypothetical protein